MTKLRTLLATVLLTLPVLTLSASQVAPDVKDSGARVEGTSQTGCCWVLWYGKWYCMPC